LIGTFGFPIIDIDLCSVPLNLSGSRGRDCMVVGFTTTYAISTYHH
jgi:hypothetical protein